MRAIFGLSEASGTSSSWEKREEQQPRLAEHRHPFPWTKIRSQRKQEILNLESKVHVTRLGWKGE
ncbi:hypothetical protein EYF80_049857 [Liparis tanakae]|uniref:Uncharacterized protein n=1 Tax=Liparis tanakae TaxID=230148 RepID=A0A4Z2FGA5_9TELE|nr:hypothetical protein EYF80_049857 [Liparis tanakae]